MLSKCANPECTAPFHYLREGKLFQIDTSAGTPQSPGPQLLDKGKPLHHIEYFWLCGQCCSIMTLAFHRGKGVVTVPLRPPAVHRAAAS
jgi:hypothetical protein